MTIYKLDYSTTHALVKNGSLKLSKLSIPEIPSSFDSLEIYWDNEISSDKFIMTANQLPGHNYKTCSTLIDITPIFTSDFQIVVDYGYLIKMGIEIKFTTTEEEPQEPQE